MGYTSNSPGTASLQNVCHGDTETVLLTCTPAFPPSAFAGDEVNSFVDLLGQLQGVGVRYNSNEGLSRAGNAVRCMLYMLNSASTSFLVVAYRELGVNYCTLVVKHEVPLAMVFGILLLCLSFSMWELP